MDLFLLLRVARAGGALNKKTRLMRCDVVFDEMGKAKRKRKGKGKGGKGGRGRGRGRGRGALVSVVPVACYLLQIRVLREGRCVVRIIC